MMKINDRGFIKSILLLAILVGVIAAGMSFGGPYYRYMTLGSHTRDFLKQDIGELEKIKQNILKDAAELKIPLDEKNVDVRLVSKVIKVKATWSETVDFYGIFQKNFDFVMEEEY